MKTIDIEKLNQLVSRTDINGNDKVKWLIDFIDGKELHQQERMYSEEEVITLLESLVEHPTKPGYKRKDILKVIEQFKKK